VAEEGFVFGYPLVAMERARTRPPPPGRTGTRAMQAPANRFVHARRATAARPDMLTSYAWLDLSAGPVIFSVPETAGRYYSVSLVDMWSEVFASQGPRTTGSGAGDHAVCGPHWNGGVLPPGARPVAAPTTVVLLAAHTHIDGDLPGALAVQDGFALTPTAETGGGARHPVGRRAPAAFFAQLGRLLREHPPRDADRPVVERLRRLGVLSGPSGWAALSADRRRAVERGVERGIEEVRAGARSLGTDGGRPWEIRYRRSRFGTDYRGRAAAALAGIATSPAADEISSVARADGDGRPLVGRHRYVLRFARDEAPPVNGFWSLTAHGGRAAGAGASRAPRSIGTPDGLVLARDGSLAIHIQHEAPSRLQESNWLRTPPGSFEVVLHLYWPQAAALAGEWAPAPIDRID
jgi:hypothetical protein